MNREATINLKQNGNVDLSAENNTIRVTSVAPSLNLGESEQSEDVKYSMGTLEYSLDSNGYVITGVGDFRDSTLTIGNYGPDGKTLVYKIGSYAFKNNAFLNEVIIPSTILEIGAGAFTGSKISNLTLNSSYDKSIYLKVPNKDKWLSGTYCIIKYVDDTNVARQVRYIGTGVGNYPGTFNFVVGGYYARMNGQIKFVANDGTETNWVDYSTLLNNDYFILGETLEGAAVEKSITQYLIDGQFISEGGLVIREHAFSNCTNLNSITIPSHAVEIEADAFANCSNLKGIHFIDDSRLAIIGQRAFENCSVDVTDFSFYLELPSSVRTIGQKAFKGNPRLKAVVFSDTLKTINPQLFYNCTGLENVTGGNYTEIGTEAFSGCTSLKYMYIPESVKIIKAKAFLNCFNYNGSYNDSNNPYQVEFGTPYTWFVAPNINHILDGIYEDWGRLGHNQLSFAITQGKLPAQMLSKLSSDFASGYADYYWTRLDKMVRPMISLTGDLLTITDPLGCAEEFYIYVNEKPRVKIWPE